MGTKADFDTIEQKNFVVKGRLTAPEVYADGMSHLALFGSMAKMLLHSVVLPKTGEDPEVRRAALHLSMPIANAIEFAHFILRAAKNREARVLDSMDPEQAAKIKRILEYVPQPLPGELSRKSGTVTRDPETGAFIPPKGGHKHRP